MLNVDLYYTLFLLFIGAGMFVFSRSLPVTLISVYITIWFFPLELKLYKLSLFPSTFLGIIEYIYILYIVRKRDYTISPYSMYIGKKSIKYIFRIVGVYALVAIFSSQIPFIQQFKGIFGLLYHSANIFLISYCFNTQKEFKKVGVLILFLIFLSGTYGIYTYILGINPFAEIVVLAHEEIADTGLGVNYIEEARGLLQGRVSAFTVHPLMFGGILALCLFVVIQEMIYSANSFLRIIQVIITIFIALLIFLTGSRSILIGAIIGGIFFVYSLYPKQSILFIGATLFLILFIGINIEDDFIKATIYFWEDNGDVSGSSKSMRFLQVDAAIEQISNIDSFFFGMGRGWASQYVARYGVVAPFYGFESIFVSSIVNMGVIGTILYIMALFIPLYNMGKTIICKFEDKRLYYSFLLSGFIIYSLTGEAYGMFLYMFFAFYTMKYSFTMNIVDRPGNTTIAFDGKKVS